MAPTQLVVFIEKQAGECMTPTSSEKRIGARKGLHRAHVWGKVKGFIEDLMNLMILFY